MLPYDVLQHHLFPILTVDQLLVLRQVNCDLKDAIDGSSIWLRLYCQQFNAPPAIPSDMARNTFLKRRKARLLRLVASGTDDEDAGSRGNALGAIAPELCIDWTRPPLPGPLAVQESRYDFDCYFNSEPVIVQSGAKAQQLATLPYREHVFGGAHIKKVVSLKGATAILTMEGEIRVVYDYDPDLDVMFSPQIYTPENGGQFVDLQIEDAYWFSRLIAIDDRGAIHLWELNELGEPPIKFDVLTSIGCEKLAPAHKRDAVVYKTRTGLYVRSRSRTTNVRTALADDFLCIRTHAGFNIIMLMQDQTVQVLEMVVPTNSRDQIKQAGIHRLGCIEKFSQTRDRLFMFASACDGTETTDPMVWVLSEQGRLIECRLQKSGPIAHAYSLTGIVNVSTIKNSTTKEYYAHHWNGATFWLKNRTARKIECNPLISATCGSTSTVIHCLPS